MRNKVLAIAAVVLSVAFVISGCGIIGEGKRYLSCEDCSNRFQEDYVLDCDDGYKCYECVFEEYSKISSDKIGKCIFCNEFYYHRFSSGAGLCPDCEETAVTWCMCCGIATLDWGEGAGYAICHDCMSKAIERKDVEKALQQFIDGE